MVDTLRGPASLDLPRGQRRAGAEKRWVTASQSPLGQMLLLVPLMEKGSRGRGGAGEGEKVKERVQRAKARPLQVCSYVCQ
jgi:hypothetical protein